MNQARRTLTEEGLQERLITRSSRLHWQVARKIPPCFKSVVSVDDILQEVWCQYLRGGYACYRNGGYICYGAIGDNSYYHSAMGGRLCYAVYPGDIAPALML